MYPATLRQILVPLDFSGPSDRALDVAVAMGRPAGARLTLLHALLPPAAFNDEGTGLSDVLALMTRDAQAKLSSRAASTGLDCEVVVSVGPPFEVILSCIDRTLPDLVVMSTHSRTGLRHVMLGSVAERVLQRSCRPVLILPRAAL